MAGLDAFGTALAQGDGAGSETFTAIANVTNIVPPNITRDTIDVTAHDSTEGWKEFIATLKDGGEVSIDVNYDPSEHDTFITDFGDSSATNYQITFPDTTVWSFAAWLTGFAAGAPYDGKLTARLTFKVTGKPTVA